MDDGFGHAQVDRFGVLKTRPLKYVLRVPTALYS